MNRNSLTTAVVAGIAGVVGIANMANAVNLNPDGLGQVLLYPYYTVNSGQQTLLSVVNTTSVGKAVKVRFLEGYNSREVLDFNLFLSKYDVWTANVFSLSDAGVSGTGAGIFTKDNSCTAPAFTSGPLTNGAGYQAFLHYGYTGSNSDGGPTGDSRTREGHFEIISMGDITSAALSTDITHVNGKPPGCAKAESDFEVGGAFTSIVAPTSGLFGAAAVVNVGHGTYYAYNADALEGFTSIPLGRGTGSLEPSLNFVNDPAPATTATANVFNNGAVVSAVYPGATQAIDAVSAVFSASNLYNQWQAAADGSVGSDWVVTFPTKRFYVDSLYAATPPIAPFESAFSAKTGLSCDVIGISLFDREENTTSTPTCGFSPCPPGQPPSSLCHETNVITFGGSSILGSTLTSNIDTSALGSNGWLGLSFTDATHGGTSPAADMHASRADNAGTIFYGLPVTGFEAENFTNGSVGGVLANYSGVYRHRNSRCADTTAAAGTCS